MNKRNGIKQIMIECPSTIFCLYVANQNELSKVELFMRNIRHVERLGLTDIYHWCNRQGISYDTQFHYQKECSLWSNIQFYMQYTRLKHMYQVSLGTA